MNRISFLNKKPTDSKIINLICAFWFVAVKLPIQLMKALFFPSTADNGIVTTVSSNYRYETASLTEVMTETYLMEEFSPFEDSEKYARLYYSPALGLVVSLIVFGTVMKLNFFKKNSHLVLNEGEKYNKLIGTPRRGLLFDVESIPVEYDEELNTWCTIDCTRVNAEVQGRSKQFKSLPKLGLTKRSDNFAAIAARTLIFSRDSKETTPVQVV